LSPEDGDYLEAVYNAITAELLAAMEGAPV
jgi:hypothetical protein